MTIIAPAPPPAKHLTYPLTLPDNGDARFTGALIDEIAAVLVAHGYPPRFDDDPTVFADLRDALASFLYAPDTDDRPIIAGDRVTWTSKRTGQIHTGTVETIHTWRVLTPDARVDTDTTGPHKVTTTISVDQLTRIGVTR